MVKKVKDIDRREYQKEYYLENKQEISKRKSERYKTDSEYKKAIAEASKRRNEKKKIERAMMREKGILNRKPYKRKNKHLFATIQDNQVKLYSVRVLADKIKKTIGTVNNYIKLGIIPNTPFRMMKNGELKGARLYTDGMISVVRDNISSRVDRRSNIGEKILQGWRDLGINI